MAFLMGPEDGFFLVGEEDFPFGGVWPFGVICPIALALLVLEGPGCLMTGVGAIVSANESSSWRAIWMT